jgi:threonine synthase
METPATYLCPACGRSLPADRPLWRCPCGGHLNLAAGRGLTRNEIDRGEASLWRYRAALSLAGLPGVSLGEGWTPLVSRDWAGTPVLFKLESQMPTGSFKDRGTAVMLNHLLEVGTGPIHEDSSGNAGSSIATYAAAAGIPCRIFVPTAAPRMPGTRKSPRSSYRYSQAAMPRITPMSPLNPARAPPVERSAKI